MLNPIATTPAATKVYALQLAEGSRDFFGEIESSNERPGTFAVDILGGNDLVGTGTRFTDLEVGQVIAWSEVPGDPPPQSGTLTVQTVTDDTHMRVVEILPPDLREMTFTAAAHQKTLVLLPMVSGRLALTTQVGPNDGGAKVWITNAPPDEVKADGGDFIDTGLSVLGGHYESAYPITAVLFVNDTEDTDARLFQLRFRPEVR